MAEAAPTRQLVHDQREANAEQFLRTVLASTNYWLTIHQYPRHHLPGRAARR